MCQMMANIMSLQTMTHILLAKEVSGALLAHYPDLPAPFPLTVLSMQDNLHTTSARYKFVTQTITCQNP